MRAVRFSKHDSLRFKLRPASVSTMCALYILSVENPSQSSTHRNSSFAYETRPEQKDDCSGVVWSSIASLHEHCIRERGRVSICKLI